MSEQSDQEPSTNVDVTPKDVFDGKVEDEQPSKPETRDDVPPRHVHVGVLVEERNRRKSAEADLTTAREEIEALRAENDQLNQSGSRYRIAAKYGISDADADLFLTGADEAAMTAQAERYAELNKTPTTPRPDPSQGAKDEPKSTSPAQAFAAAFKGRI